MSMLQLFTALPRKSHSDGAHWLDLAYVTPQLVVTSMPTTDYWQSWYRTPATSLAAFLTRKHADKWAVWNLQEAHETGYEDEALGGKVSHWPVPDNAPPRYADLLAMVGEIAAHVLADPTNVAVIHCKAGQGRSGTVACAYLQLVHGQDAATAIAWFTAHRLHRFLGPAVSIPSQVRYLRYVERHPQLQNLPSLNRISAVITSVILRGPAYHNISVQLKSALAPAARPDNTASALETASPVSPPADPDPQAGPVWDVVSKPSGESSVLIFYPVGPPAASLVDVHIRVKGEASFQGVSVTHSFASVWFNAYLEEINSARRSSKTAGSPYPSIPATEPSGYFSASWRQLDGIEGFSFKGVKLFDMIEVHWNLFEGDFPEDQYSARTSTPLSQR